MNCRKCNTPYEPTPSVYQMESRNRLFCFEDVPALKCPECEHLYIPEQAVRIILEQIAILSHGSPIPYIKWKWNKKSNIQTPDELADELLSKSETPEDEEEEESSKTETEGTTQAPTEKNAGTKTVRQHNDGTDNGQTKQAEQRTKTAAPERRADPAPDTVQSTRTKGVVVRKRKRAKADSAA